MQLSSLLVSTNESSTQRFQRTGLILFAFGVALLMGTLYRICALWFGGIPTWPILCLVGGIGLLSGWLLRAVSSFRLDKIAAIGCLIVTFFLFWDVQAICDFWTGLYHQVTPLTYTQWLRTVVIHMLLWLAPPMLWVTFAWVRAKHLPRGRLSLFVSMCIGIIFTHFLITRIATAFLILIALLLMAEGLFLICSSTLKKATLRRRLTLIMPLLGILLIGASPVVYKTVTAKETSHSPAVPELLRFYPFAPIAAGDLTLPLAPPSAAYIQKHGAYLRTDKAEDLATLAVSQQLATILKPASDARRGFRPLVNATEEIKGQYDVLWVEVPPAWQSEERDYFDKGVVKSLLETVNENGYLIYHMDIRPLTLTALLTRAEALALHFPYIQLWVTSETHWQLVASRKAPPIQPLPPAIGACRVSTQLCALKTENDALGFRLFETWYARKELFNPDHKNVLDKPLIQRITNASTL